MAGSQSLPELFVGVKAKLMHGKQDAAVDRLQPISHIRQCSPNND